MALVVVTAVRAQPVGPSAWPADSPADRRHTVEERDQLGDVVAVSAGDRPGKRDPRRVYEKVMLRPVSGSINRARARFGAPLSEWSGARQAPGRVGFARGPCLILVLDP
jgi:hypothetical protein